MNDIKDILGLSEPIVKLIEIMARGTGVLYKPTAIKKEAKAQAGADIFLAEAKADEIRLIAAANVDAKKMLALADLDIESRARCRTYFQETKRQNNLEHIADLSVDYLNDEVGEEPIEDEWIHRFINNAQDISDEDMQDVWAKILAGNINKPGSYSTRTLEILKTITKAEAEIFQKLVNLCFMDKFVIKLDYAENSLPDYDIAYYELLILRTAGLLQVSDMLKNNFTVPIYPNWKGIPTHDCTLNIRHKTERWVEFNTMIMTPSGCELSKLIEAVPNANYLKAVVEQYEKKGFEVQIDRNET